MKHGYISLGERLPEVIRNDKVTLLVFSDTSGTYYILYVAYVTFLDETQDVIRANNRLFVFRRFFCNNHVKLMKRKYGYPAAIA